MPWPLSKTGGKGDWTELMGLAAANHLEQRKKSNQKFDFLGNGKYITLKMFVCLLEKIGNMMIVIIRVIIMTNKINIYINIYDKQNYSNQK